MSDSGAAAEGEAVVASAARPWLLDGVAARVVATPRLRANVLSAGSGDALPVVLVHGNVSSSHLYQETMLALSGPSIAIDLRGFGDSETLPVDATRGLGDYADDVASVLDELGIARAVLVGWSMGGGVVLRLLIDRPDLVAGLVLESPVSPYGFGGTRLDGSLVHPDAPGTGGGGANPDFVARLAAGDTTAEVATSPRSVLRAAYVAPGYASDLEDLWVASMLTTSTAPGCYPGDATTIEAWPGFAPGTVGVLNTMAPTVCDLTGIVDGPVHPPIAWVRGEADAIVSDASFFDLNMLGKAGVVPGWPGDDVAPPQPMVSQMRAVLARYADAGGSVEEHAWEGVGHAPHLERVEEFARIVEAMRARAAG
ncbi:alpha/beta fold hydrolase [Agrococcus sp. SGAir0287]|uniref:alpha/beta fold hydrolase n=1 Tax=Agrococcus sp. SGAir0287 TaxID=2070347 RepID=UPI0010CD2908|nr:alpha/beta hydrolase [Agrococcus sp. SGAir0287]QCR19771.1 alpha/beta hydrolase [Agrococcus sp. SGAir0287]